MPDNCASCEPLNPGCFIPVPAEPAQPMAQGRTGSPGCSHGVHRPVCFRVHSNGKTYGRVLMNETQQT